MSVFRNSLSALSDPFKGLIVLPAIIVCTYGLLCYMIHLQSMCMRADIMCDFWSYPQFAGLNLFDLFTLVNILFAAFVLVSAWSVLTDRRGRSRRRILVWGTFGFLIALLAGLQTYQTKVGVFFGIPDEILSLRTEQFHDYHGRRVVEDLILPKSDMCEGFRRPFEKRCTINITRPGHYVRDRRDLGHVRDAGDRIRSQLIEDTSRHEREPSGASKLILLVRGDYEVQFGPIREVLEICWEEEIGIYRIEFACRCDLERKYPEAAGKLNWYYSLPEGKIDVRFPGTGSLRDVIAVKMIADEEQGFLCAVNGKSMEGPDRMQKLFASIEALRAEGKAESVALDVSDTIELDHVIDVLAECRRAGITDLSFAEGGSPKENF